MPTRTRNIVIFIHHHRGWDRDVVKGIARYARMRTNWRLFLWPSMQTVSHLPATWRCDGAIGRNYEAVSEVTAGAPLVPLAHLFRPDHRAIGHLAAEHLHDSGFRRMTFYGGQEQWEVQRGSGFREKVEGLGARFLPCPLVFSNRDDIDWTNEAATLARWLGSLDYPMGVMGVNDIAARVVSQACDLAELRVPEQVGIVGVDNDLMLCELSGTPLSSVDPAADSVGYAAAEALDRWLTRGQAPTPIMVPPRGVVHRRSSDVLAIEDSAIANALRFLRNHAYEPLGVEDVAAAACLSRKVLERRFKLHVGRSVQQEITRLRIRQACELLRNTDDRLDRVAAASGFDSLSYFHSVFKRHTGRTPAAYRRWTPNGRN